VPVPAVQGYHGCNGFQFSLHAWMHTGPKSSLR
jgi:hypothetical protein